MTVMKRRRTALVLAISALGLFSRLFAQGLDSAAAPRPTDSATPESLPSIGLWMINSSGVIAHWLGEKIEGRAIQEPINIIIVDSLSKDGEEAMARLTSACEKSEFEKRVGHSGGYSAYIDGEVYPQIPKEKMSAYSDGLFEFPNNHGRLFGPAPWGSGFVFIGAFSRERTNIVTRVMHLFTSFDQARDAFARAMARSGRYEIAGFVPLGNAIVGSSEYTTGDHDGIAVLLRAIPAPGKAAPAARKPVVEPSAAAVAPGAEAGAQQPEAAPAASPIPAAPAEPPLPEAAPAAVPAPATNAPTAAPAPAADEPEAAVPASSTNAP
ncbi:MAG TPA: hypothetical protein VMV90_16400 [Rectinemataceae bacterium]|nr:hypothetical protein [Rectinemataceae bacterium]